MASGSLSAMFRPPLAQIFSYAIARFAQWRWYLLEQCQRFWKYLLRAVNYDQKRYSEKVFSLFQYVQGLALLSWNLGIRPLHKSSSFARLCKKQAQFLTKREYYIASFFCANSSCRIYKRALNVLALRLPWHRFWTPAYKNFETERWGLLTHLKANLHWGRARSCRLRRG